MTEGRWNHLEIMEVELFDEANYYECIENSSKYTKGRGYRDLTQIEIP